MTDSSPSVSGLAGTMTYGNGKRQTVNHYYGGTLDKPESFNKKRKGSTKKKNKKSLLNR